MSYQQVLERLGKPYEFRDIVLSDRRRGYLERGEALRLIALLKELVNDINGGETRLTLHLLDVAEELVNDPSSLVKRDARRSLVEMMLYPCPRSS